MEWSLPAFLTLTLSLQERGMRGVAFPMGTKKNGSMRSAALWREYDQP